MDNQLARATTLLNFISCSTGPFFYALRDPHAIVSLIAETVCKARSLAFCTRRKIIPQEIVHLSGGFVPSPGHSSRICKILCSELYRQVRLYRQALTTSLRCTSDPVGALGRIRAFSRFVDQRTEWLWQRHLKQLRSRLPGKRPTQRSPVHGAAQLNLPGFVHDALSLGPKFAVEKRRPPEELLSMFCCSEAARASKCLLRFVPPKAMVELDRAEWAEKTDIFLLFMTATVGLGNVYAFPYSIYTNGFGAYLLLYVFFLVVVGQPLYLLEATMGQFSSCGPLHVFSCFPLAKGLGVSMCLLAAMRTMDAGLVLTQGMLYWVGSFTPRMPWMTCDSVWGADLPTCYVRSTGIRLCDPTLKALVENKAAVNLTDQNRLHAVPVLYQGNVVFIVYQYYINHLQGCVLANQSSAEQYYTNHILNKGPSPISRELMYCSAAVWLLIFLAALNIRNFMWVLRLVAPSPLVILTLFLFFTIQKSGAGHGISIMLHVPQYAFYDLTLWHNAAADALGSLGIATGAIMVFASFNPLKTPIKSIVQGIVAMDFATSLVSACLMFSVLGNLAHVTGQAAETYVRGGSTKMFFMLISEYIGEANYPQLFASLFTITLLQLGLCQAVAGIWTLVTCLTDEFTTLRPLTGSLIAAFCMVGCVASLPYTTPYGYLIALLVNRFAVQIPVLLVACMETLSFVWGYGVDRLLFDVRFMEQGTLSNYWIRCWSLWTPCVLLGVLVATFVTLQDFVDDLASNYNVQAKFACQFLLVGMLAGVPVLTMEWLMENNLDVNLSLLPCAHWGPREAIYFRAYHEAIKHSDLPAQKKVHKTDRKETVAERFTLYLVHHSPKYMGRFIKRVTNVPPNVVTTSRLRDPFPCE